MARGQVVGDVGRLRVVLLIGCVTPMMMVFLIGGVTPMMKSRKQLKQPRTSQMTTTTHLSYILMTISSPVA